MSTQWTNQQKGTCILSSQYSFKPNLRLAKQCKTYWNPIPKLRKLIQGENNFSNTHLASHKTRQTKRLMEVWIFPTDDKLVGLQTWPRWLMSVLQCLVVSSLCCGLWGSPSAGSSLLSLSTIHLQAEAGLCSLAEFSSCLAYACPSALVHVCFCWCQHSAPINVLFICALIPSFVSWLPDWTYSMLCKFLWEY